MQRGTMQQVETKLEMRWPKGEKEEKEGKKTREKLGIKYSDGLR